MSQKDQKFHERYFLFILSFILFIASIFSIYSYNQKYQKEVIEYESYKKAIQETLKENYPNSYIDLFLTYQDEENNTIFIYKIVYNKDSLTPTLYHAMYKYPIFQTKEVQLYKIKTEDACIAKRKLLYEEDIAWCIYNLYPEYRGYKNISITYNKEENLWIAKVGDKEIKIAPDDYS